MSNRARRYHASPVNLEGLVSAGAVNTHRHQHDELIIETLARDCHGTPMLARQAVSTPIRKLLEQGAIGQAEADAASRLRYDYDMATGSGLTVRLATPVDGGRNGGGDAGFYLAERMGRVRAAMAHLGTELGGIIRDGVLFGHGFGVIGARLFPGGTRQECLGAGRAALAIALRELAVFYGMRRGRGIRHGTIC